MKVEALAYVRIGVVDAATAAERVADLLGLTVTERQPGYVLLRGGDFAYCILIDEGGPNGSVGLQVRDEETLNRISDHVAASGLSVARATSNDCAARRVKAMVCFTDFSGNGIELVVRPQIEGWHFYGARDLGIAGLQSVTLRSTAIADDTRLWREVLGARVADWVGNGVFLGIDDAHHRIALHPAAAPGVIATTLEIADIDRLMRSTYLLRDRQVRIVHGPGRDPVSGRMFVTFALNDGVLMTLATAQDARAGCLSRQFADRPESRCGWGSACDIADYGR